MLQPTAWLFSTRLSCMYLKGIEGLHESRTGLETVASVYSVSRYIGMCFSQLDDILCREVRPDLVFVSQ